MCKNIYTVFYLLIFQISYTSIKAQARQLRFKHYTTNDGLSQGSADRITSDSRGFIWVSTGDGLNRFDGYNFKVFKTLNNDSTSIAGNRINSVIEDKSGMLWIGSDEALNRYDFKTDRFKHFYLADSLHRELKAYYEPFFIDDKSELFFIFSTSLASMNLATGKITTYAFAHGAMEGCTTVDYPQGKFYKHLAKIYTTGNSGLHIIDMDKRKINFYFSSNPKNEFGSRLRINKALEDKNHILWLSAMKGLMYFNPLTKENQLYDEYKGKKIVSSMGIDWDKDGNLWCASAGMGLSIYNTTAKKFIGNYTKNPVDPESIGRNFAKSLFIGKDNNVWIGIEPDGFDKVNTFYQQLNCVKISLPRDEGYSSSLGALYEIDTNHLVICSNHADIILYNKTTGASQKAVLPRRLERSTNLTAILDSRKRIWVSSDSGLYCSDEKLKTFKMIEKKTFDHGTLFEFNQKIFIGTIGGLFAIPINTQARVVDTLHLFDGKIISFIGKSPGGLLCVTTLEKELFLVDINDAKPVVIKKADFYFHVESVFFQDENILWLGTNAGLVRYNISKNSLKLFTEKDGLANNFVYCVFKGNDGKLWMSTNHGISRFDITTERFTNYGLTEGAQSFEFNEHSSYQSSYGTIYFGGVKGFNYFNPSTIKDFPFDPPVQSLNVTVNGSTAPLEKFLDQKRPVKFPSNENNISLEFAAIDFNRNDNINYLYKLHDKDAWISIGNRRTLNFANLSPGNYHFEVEAQYSYNAVSPHILKLAFAVLSPFYEKGSFIAAISIIIILIIYSIYRYRINQFLKFQAVRNSIARDLHDDIGSTLGSINMYSEVASNRLEKQNAGQAEEVLQKIGFASREMIEKMNDIVWNIDSRNDTFEKLCYRMHAFASMILTPREIEFAFNSNDQLNRLPLDMKLRRNIFLIYKESIYNIVKYAACKKVWINLNKEDHIFKMIIKDDGKGFDSNTNAAYNGNGIKNMKTRANAIHGKFYISSIINEGTKIEFEIRL